MLSQTIKVSILSLIAFFVIAGTAQAQATANPQPAPPPEPAEEGFSSERPGFTSGTETIPPGRFQLEAGYTYVKQGSARIHLLNDGGQVRFPLNIRSEVRLGVPGYALISDSGQKTSGWSSSSISGKVRFLDETKVHPALALIVGTTLPTGSKDTSEHYFQPIINLEASRSLGERCTLQANYIYTAARDNGEKFNQYAGGLNLGFQVLPNVSVFGEVYRVAPTGAGGSPNADYFDTGVVLVQGNKMQFDINGGVGLTKDVRHDYFIGAGISRRW